MGTVFSALIFLVCYGLETESMALELTSAYGTYALLLNSDGSSRRTALVTAELNRYNKLLVHTSLPNVVA